MLTILMILWFTLSLLAWLACLTTVVLLAILVAVAIGRMFVQALRRGFRSLFGHPASHDGLPSPDSQFFRAAGIKR